MDVCVLGSKVEDLVKVEEQFVIVEVTPSLAFGLYCSQGE